MSERKAVTGQSPMNASAPAPTINSSKDVKLQDPSALPPPQNDAAIVSWKSKFAAYMENAQELERNQGAIEADYKADIADFNQRAAAIAPQMEAAAAEKTDSKTNKPSWLQKIENSSDVKRALAKAQKEYVWAPTTDGYPPHMTPNLPYREDWGALSLFGLKGSITAFLAEFNTNSSASNDRYKKISDFPKKSHNDTGTIGSQFNDDWWSDEHFGEMRLYGPNPMVIKRAKTTDDIPNALNLKSKIDKTWNDMGFGSFSDDLKNGRVFVCDYAPLGVCAAGASQNGTPNSVKDRWLPIPIAILYLKEQTKLIPAIIQIDQSSTSVAFTRPKDQSSSNQWGWRWAKTCVNAADWNYHELGFHLTFTHLVEEVLIVSSRRTLPDMHPVMLLLSQHFSKTLSLNKKARDTLVPDVIALVGPCDTASDVTIVNRLYDKYWNFQNQYVPTDLSNRNLDNFDFYLYGKWALQAWTSIRNFVNTVIHGFYNNDQEVQADGYLKAWHDDVVGTGKMGGFPNLDSRDKLRDAITMAIYTASYQHSAVNYQQYFYMGYSPSMSGSMYGKQPTQSQANDFSQDDLARALPPKEYANLETALVWTLSQAPGSEDQMITSFNNLTKVYSKAPNGGDKTDKWVDAVKQSLKELNAAVDQTTDKNSTVGAKSMGVAYKPKVNAGSIVI